MVVAEHGERMTHRPDVKIVVVVQLVERKRDAYYMHSYCFTLSLDKALKTYMVFWTLSSLRCFTEASMSGKGYLFLSCSVMKGGSHILDSCKVLDRAQILPPAIAVTTNVIHVEHSMLCVILKTNQYKRKNALFTPRKRYFSGHNEYFRQYHTVCDADDNFIHLQTYNITP